MFISNVIFNSGCDSVKADVCQRGMFFIWPKKKHKISTINKHVLPNHTLASEVLRKQKQKHILKKHTTWLLYSAKPNIGSGDSFKTT